MEIGFSQAGNLYLINKSIALRTELIKGLSSWPRTLRAGKAPTLSEGTAAPVPLVEAPDVLSADTEPVVKVAGLPAFVDTGSAGRVQGETCGAGLITLILDCKDSFSS